MRPDIRPNPRKTDSVRRLGPVDVAALREAALALSEADWAAEQAGKPNRHYAALDATQHIIFRFITNFLDWREAADRPPYDSRWHALIEPVIAQAVAPYGYADGAFPRIMLARMAPGGVIQPHRDENPSAKWPHKIHVPLTTNDETVFFVDGQGYHFPVGEAVEVNNMATHAVRNDGPGHRIHLIFEYYDRAQTEPEWLEAVAAMQPARPPA